ncbi:uncharacterized protein LOC124171246 [Ischnura elegans]|uniref:uncharacterized protein LOC124171246 n=1 Tax=Ischnura elegans TaxID=197161 RepID=UPI001ED899E6|nr:uncharacterized protein LOC124171246 [Ischnura elegans]
MRILLRASKALLRERVHHTRLSLHRCSEELYKIHLQLSSSLNATDWDKIEKITYFTSQNVEITARKTQIKKFDKLQNRQHPSDQHLRDRSVVNLTERVLDDATTSVLSKGHNFAIAPRNLPMERIITEVESAIRKLPKDDAAEIREDVSHILRTAKPPKQNLSAAEREALSKLKSDESLIILRADKGNATVLMTRKDYNEKISQLLDDPAYQQLKSNPTTRIERQVKELIKRSSIPQETQRNLIPRAAKPPRLYGLPKIHKEGVPLRPIVSQIETGYLATWGRETDKQTPAGAVALAGSRGGDGGEADLTKGAGVPSSWRRQT